MDTNNGSISGVVAVQGQENSLVDAINRIVGTGREFSVTITVPGMQVEPAADRGGRDATESRGGGLQEKPRIAERELDLIVINMMREIGVPEHIKGYRYIHDAVMMLVVDYGLLDMVTKKLYPSVAKKHLTTPSRVERAIRHAVECVWSNAWKLDYLNSMFGHVIDPGKGKPTNSQFLAVVVNAIRAKYSYEAAV